MSAVLMCDSCGNIFSVNQKGWKEYTETISSLESNPYNVGKRQQHVGPCCAFQTSSTFPKIRQPEIAATVVEDSKE
jgi:hypothetical protein